MPGPHSYIQIDDFAGPKELADYLKKLAANETLYNGYFEWKRRPPSRQFREVVDSSGDRFTSLCRLCERLARNETTKPLPKLNTPAGEACLPGWAAKQG